MKKELVLGVLGGCVVWGNGERFKEWEEGEINGMKGGGMEGKLFG